MNVESGGEMGEGESSGPVLAVDAKYAIIGGAVTALVTFGGAFLVGTMTSFKALELTESVAPSIRFLSSSIMTACATVLALILTLLSISSNTLDDVDLQDTHYMRMKQIGLMCISALILSLILLMMVSVPFKEADDIPTNLYTYVYYAVVGFAALIAGLFVTMVLSLYDALKDIIEIFHSGLKSDAKVKEKRKEEEREEE